LNKEQRNNEERAYPRYLLSSEFQRSSGLYRRGVIALHFYLAACITCSAV